MAGWRRSAHLSSWGSVEGAVFTMDADAMAVLYEFRCHLRAENLAPGTAPSERRLEPFVSHMSQKCAEASSPRCMGDQGTAWSPLRPELLAESHVSPSGRARCVSLRGIWRRAWRCFFGARNAWSSSRCQTAAEAVPRRAAFTCGAAPPPNGVQKRHGMGQRLTRMVKT